MDDSSSYRALCILDTPGKLLEQLLMDRLKRGLEASIGLSRRQFGFREGRSTINAKEADLKLAEEARSGTK